MSHRMSPTVSARGILPGRRQPYTPGMLRFPRKTARLLHRPDPFPVFVAASALTRLAPVVRQVFRWTCIDNACVQGCCSNVLCQISNGRALDRIHLGGVGNVSALERTTVLGRQTTRDALAWKSSRRLPVSDDSSRPGDCGCMAGPGTLERRGETWAIPNERLGRRPSNLVSAPAFVTFPARQRATLQEGITMSTCLLPESR